MPPSSSEEGFILRNNYWLLSNLIQYHPTGTGLTVATNFCGLRTTARVVPTVWIYNLIRAKHPLLFTFHSSLFSARQGICPFCFAKDGLLSSSLSYLFCYSQRKGIKEKSLIPFLARKERLDRASPVLFASQTFPFFCPFCFAKDGLLSSSLSHLFCYTQRKGIKEKSLIPFLARKERLELSRRFPDLRP